jgi:hypothetical protein
MSKIVINIEKLYLNDHPEDDPACRKQALENLLKALNRSQLAMEETDGTTMKPGEHFAIDKYRSADRCVQMWLDLMSWAREHHADYLYDRALERLLDELFKQGERER